MKNIIILFVLISTGLFGQNVYKMPAFKKVEPKTLKANISKMILGYVTYQPYQEIITKPTDIMTFDVGVSLAYYLIQDSQNRNYLNKDIANVISTEKGPLMIFFLESKGLWAIDFLPGDLFIRSGEKQMKIFKANETKELVNLLME